jgi:hypothetical protein
LGYCCPEEGSSIDGCEPNEELNRVCSNYDLGPPDMYYQACLNVDKEEICGSKRRQLSFSKQVLRVGDLPFNQQPVCIYEIFDEVQGFRKWGPYNYWLKFKEIKNMKVIVAAGEKFSKAEVLFSTELKTLIPGYKIKIEASDKAWIAVVPEG